MHFAQGLQEGLQEQALALALVLVVVLVPVAVLRPGASQEAGPSLEPVGCLTCSILAAD